MAASSQPSATTAYPFAGEVETSPANAGFWLGIEHYSDSTQRLKAWASASSQLRFSLRVHRLIIAPPAGDSPKS